MSLGLHKSNDSEFEWTHTKAHQQKSNCSFGRVKREAIDFKSVSPYDVRYLRFRHLEEDLL